MGTVYQLKVIFAYCRSPFCFCQWRGVCVCVFEAVRVTTATSVLDIVTDFMLKMDVDTEIRTQEQSGMPTNMGAGKWTKRSRHTDRRSDRHTVKDRLTYQTDEQTDRHR